MATPLQITDTLIQDSFVRSISAVFGTMMNHEIVFLERKTVVEPPPADGNTQIIGNIGFVGDANGLVYICLPEEFAKVAAGRMLGMDIVELMKNGNEALNDAMGEITNMTVGGFKNSLADAGYPCRLTVPSIVRGKGLTVSCFKGAVRNIFHFECNGHRVSADVQMQIE